jgi:hypothetical protein
VNSILADSDSARTQTKNTSDALDATVSNNLQIQMAERLLEWLEAVWRVFSCGIRKLEDVEDTFGSYVHKRRFSKTFRTTF